MERHGIKVDRERLAGLSTQFASAINDLESAVFGLCGQEFTIGSPKQLGDVLDQLEEAVSVGRLSMERVDQSLTRVITLKASGGCSV